MSNKMGQLRTVCEWQSACRKNGVRSCTSTSEEKEMKRFVLVPLAIAAALASSPVAFADDVAYSTVSGQGIQTWTGDLANFFTVNSNLTINSLGVFNAAGNGIIGGSSPIEVAIYSVTPSGATSLVASATFAPGSYYEQGYYVYQSIAPVNLTPGTYEVDAVGFGAANPNGSLANPNGNINNGSVAPTLNTFGGEITYLEGFSEYSSSTTLGALTADQTYDGSTYAPAGGYGFPTQSNGGYVDRWGGADASAPAIYDAGSFGVPERGTTLALLGLAVAGLAGLRRKLSV